MKWCHVAQETPTIQNQSVAGMNPPILTVLYAEYKNNEYLGALGALVVQLGKER
jgi:hypothetical protein